jgi:hypothetical protein
MVKLRIRLPPIGAAAGATVNVLLAKSPAANVIVAGVTVRIESGDPGTGITGMGWGVAMDCSGEGLGLDDEIGVVPTPDEPLGKVGCCSRSTIGPGIIVTESLVELQPKTRVEMRMKVPRDNLLETLFITHHL